ncbi:MAG TPA: MarR family transcriptional regulator [Terracidiphilus sp.]|nr:MarR family transcriptional regulator [Terracidiphilus sp.]
MGKKEKQVEPGLGVLAEQVTADLDAIRRAMKRPLEMEAARGGLTPAQTTVMSVMVREGGMSLKDLSAAVGLAHSTVSGIVDRLTKRGMLKRRPDPDDRRFSRIHPTAAVTDFVREMIPTLQRKPLETALARLSEAERNELQKLLARLRGALESPQQGIAGRTGNLTGE